MWCTNMCFNEAQKMNFFVGRAPPNTANPAHLQHGNQNEGYSSNNNSGLAHQKCSWMKHSADQWFDRAPPKTANRETHIPTDTARHNTRPQQQAPATTTNKETNQPTNGRQKQQTNKNSINNNRKRTTTNKAQPTTRTTHHDNNKNRRQRQAAKPTDHDPNPTSPKSGPLHPSVSARNVDSTKGGTLAKFSPVHFSYLKTLIHQTAMSCVDFVGGARKHHHGQNNKLQIPLGLPHESETHDKGKKSTSDRHSFLKYRWVSNMKIRKTPARSQHEVHENQRKITEVQQHHQRSGSKKTQTKPPRQ